MRQITIVTGILCILLGLGLVAGALHDNKHWYTAAIPAYVGIVWLVLGLLSTTERARMIVGHLLSVFALILAGASIARGLPKLIQYHNGTLPPGAPELPLAWWGQVTLGIILLAYLALAIRFFVHARRWRRAQAGSEVGARA